MNRKLLLSLVECPVCWEAKENTPIFECKKGHLVCEGCFLLLPGTKEKKCCPIAKCPYDYFPHRSRVAELIINEVKNTYSYQLP